MGFGGGFVRDPDLDANLGRPPFLIVCVVVRVARVHDRLGWLVCVCAVHVLRYVGFREFGCWCALWRTSLTLSTRAEERV